MAKRIKVLFVDDEERIVKLLSIMFRARYDVFTATNAQDALAIFNQHQIHIVVSDQCMPGMTGIELLTEIRRLYPNTIRILLTGYMDLIAIIGSINEGEVYRFLNKPWDQDELKDVIAECAQLVLAIDGNSTEDGDLQSQPSAASNLFSPDNRDNDTQSVIMEMLQADFGSAIWEVLADRTVTEVSVNSDGTIWVSSIGRGRIKIPETMRPERVFSVIAIVANIRGEKIGDANPSFDTIIPGYGFRFVGTVPPLSIAPTFTIRKKPEHVISLDEYEQTGIVTSAQKSVLMKAIENRENIMICGRTASGKTTLANALLKEMAKSNHRIITIEHTPELQNSADDRETYYTVPNVRSMQDILHIALRKDPDHLVFGEVQGPEIRDVIAAWNTGHRGGLSTIHADSAIDALYRIEEMLEIAPNYQTKPRAIARAINLIAFMATTSDLVTYPAGRYVKELIRVVGLKEDGGYAVQ